MTILIYFPWQYIAKAKSNPNKLSCLSSKEMNVKTQFLLHGDVTQMKRKNNNDYDVIILITKVESCKTIAVNGYCNIINVDLMTTKWSSQLSIYYKINTVKLFFFVLFSSRPCRYQIERNNCIQLIFVGFIIIYVLYTLTLLSRSTRNRNISLDV